MWFDGQRKENTAYIASVSRGKDSTAMLRAIQLMGWPLDGIVSCDIWFDENIPAELPEMAAFKDDWDAKCLYTFGVPVTRMCALRRDGSKETYKDIFYWKVRPERERERERDRTVEEKGRSFNLRIPYEKGLMVSVKVKARRSN